MIERNELGNTMKNEIVSLGIVSRCTDYIKVAERNDIKNKVSFIGSVTFLFNPVCPFLYIFSLSLSFPSSQLAVVYASLIPVLIFLK